MGDKSHSERNPSVENEEAIKGEMSPLRQLTGQKERGTVHKLAPEGTYSSSRLAVLSVHYTAS